MPVVFDPNVDSALNARAKVSKIKGSISGISVAKETISGVKFYREDW